jgi:hypothetical protein
MTEIPNQAPTEAVPRSSISPNHPFPVRYSNFQTAHPQTGPYPGSTYSDVLRSYGTVIQGVVARIRSANGKNLRPAPETDLRTARTYFKSVVGSRLLNNEQALLSEIRKEF